MRVFLTGATGWIGSVIVNELLDAGHSVVGLVQDSETALGRHADYDPLVGSLDDNDLLRRAAEDADGVIHTAFGSGFSNYEKLAQQDIRAIEAFGEAYAGSDRPIIVTHGLGTLPDGETFTEADRPRIISAYPRASEQTAFALAERGIHGRR